MEKVIYLEPDDEITGVIDKIKKVNQDRVILVVPKAATILQSVVNLKILKQQAVRLGKAISIVTSDETGRNLASQIGLTVYRDLAKRPIAEKEKPINKEDETEKDTIVVGSPEAKQPEEETSPTFENKIESEKPEPKPEHHDIEKSVEPITKKEEQETPKGVIDIRSSGVRFKPFKDEKRAGIGLETISQKPIKATKDIHQISSLKKLKIAVIILLVLAILEGIMAYFLLPKANVNVILKAEKLDKTYEILAQKDAVYNEETGTIPANVYTIEKESSKDFPTTGTKEVGEKAKGTIALTNETGTDQPLVATTRFVTSAGLVFRSTAAVTVPKAYLDPGGNKINGTASVSVVADASGEKYNIAPSSFTIPGLAASIQNKVYGRSAAAMSGGSTRKIKIVSEEDVTKAQNEIMAELINSSKEEALSKSNKDEDMALEGSAGGVVISGVPSPIIGTEAETFKYTLKAQINVITVKKSEFYNILSAKVNKEIAQDKELPKGELENTTENKVVNIDTAIGKMQISSHINAPIVAKMDMDVMKNNLKGKNSGDAVKYLKSFEEIYDAQITLWPFYAKKMPNVKRIFINTSYQLSQ